LRAMSASPTQSSALRTAEWWMGVLFAIGSTCFAVSAHVQPSTSEPVSAAIANAGTTAGALCFFAGALMLIPKSEAHAHST
jgi:hypothetical protein